MTKRVSLAYMSTPAKFIAVIIVAAGKGERAQGSGASEPKQYRKIGGQPVISRTIEAFLAHDAVSAVVPVIHPDHEALYADLGLSDARLRPAVPGGASRQASVLAGLKAIAAERPQLVLIQDAARPFVSIEQIDAVLGALASHDGALPTLPLTDTIKRSVDGQLVLTTEDRRTLFAAQTPQGFRFGQLFSAHMRAESLRRDFTDDAEIAEWAGLRVAMTAGDRANFKITHPDDFRRAERQLTGDMGMETRIGTGYDVHSFEPGDAVWLGGVKIPHHSKLNGHSDADVALHALTDAILGAIGEGDIGIHFPPSDEQWRGAASTIFLKHAGNLVAQRGGRIVNLDITLVCEAPRIAKHAPAMCSVIAETLGIKPSRVAVKATTNEKLGFIGREEGIVAMASASIELPREE
jgi:2-C-methyl-D-erythritol 4-phosphate cytidylyltransferase/2-C-methyl-D-erythritol 2,4-cyclodiphosphate synthase